MNREAELRRDIAGLDAVTADFEAAAKDLLKESELSPSNARAREEVIALLGVNYVGPEIFNKIFEPNSFFDRFKLAIRQLTRFKDGVTPVPFEEPQLDFVRLKEILNEADEWTMGKKKFQTYALVFKSPRSFLELREKANEGARATGKTPAFFEDWYSTRAFATEVPNSGSWELVRRETVPGSTSKILDDQKALIADMPNLAPTSFSALAALLAGQYLAHEIKLYNGVWHYGRTTTSAASDGPVRLGGLDANGADVHADGIAHGSIGLAVSRILN